jgi:hypothetical protein
MRDVVHKMEARKRAGNIESRLTLALEGIPQGNKIERAATLAFARQAKNKDAPDALKAVEENFQSTYGQPLEHFSYLREKVEGAQGFGSETKTAAIGKWAEMLKSIPAPTPSQLAIVQNHAARMPDLPPQLLEDLSSTPDESLRGLAHLGIVLRPDEFQYMALAGNNRDAAEGYRSGGIVFKSSPLDMERMPEFQTEPRPSMMTLDILRQVLGGLLSQRSFAPPAVRIRITRVMPVQSRSSFQHSDDVLDKISQAYNDYRGGLIFSRPSLHHLQLPESGDIFDLGQEVKLADASVELSRLLFHLAYWSTMPVG